MFGFNLIEYSLPSKKKERRTIIEKKNFRWVQVLGA